MFWNSLDNDLNYQFLLMKIKFMFWLLKNMAAEGIYRRIKHIIHNDLMNSHIFVTWNEASIDFIFLSGRIKSCSSMFKDKGEPYWNCHKKTYQKQVFCSNVVNVIQLSQKISFCGKWAILAQFGQKLCNLISDDWL